VPLRDRPLIVLAATDDDMFLGLAIEANVAGGDAVNVEKNLSTIVRVRQKLMRAHPALPGVFTLNNRTS
jgi:hypothetical protein